MPLGSTNAQGKVLGILKPVGGGDPIPLLKSEIVVGRRRSSDIFLDFNNISGKHCQLRLINSVWHVRDLGSTNGTSLNGMALTSEHSVLPDDELGIASHLFTIDYEPGGPESVVHAIEDMADEAQGRRHSLLELAGIDNDDARPRSRGKGPAPAQAPPTPGARPPASAEPVFNDEIPDDFKSGSGGGGGGGVDDDDFLKLIEEDVKKAGDQREGRKR
jgi:hypothetical protein